MIVNKTIKRWLKVFRCSIIAFVFSIALSGCAAQPSNIASKTETVSQEQPITAETAQIVTADSAKTVQAPVETSVVPKTTGCKMSNYLPDKECDPGSIDPRVTQDNLGTTICKSGYTATVRPSSSVTDKMKIIDMAAYGFTDSKSNYEYDHIIALELGGSPADTRNLFPEPYAEPYGARTKDKVENKLKALVCAGTMTLAEAQKEISTDWISVYNRYYSVDTTTSTTTTTPAAVTPTTPVVTPVTPIPAPVTTSEPQVKKSTTGICHEKGVSQYYNQTKNYTSYDSVADCLASGGRLPK